MSFCRPPLCVCFRVLWWAVQQMFAGLLIIIGLIMGPLLWSAQLNKDVIQTGNRLFKVFILTSWILLFLDFLYYSFRKMCDVFMVLCDPLYTALWLSLHLALIVCSVRDLVVSYLLLSISCPSETEEAFERLCFESVFPALQSFDLVVCVCLNCGRRLELENLLPWIFFSHFCLTLCVFWHGRLMFVGWSSTLINTNINIPPGCPPH